MTTAIIMTEAGGTMAGHAATADLVRLMTWLSPGFPVGAFSYSHGLERAVHDGLVDSAGTVERWLADLVERGSGWNDAVMLAEAWHASHAGDRERLRAAAELSEAMAAGAERHLETMQQGSAFLAAAGPWSADTVRSLRGRASYPVAVGAVAGGNEIALGAVAGAYLNGFVGNLVSAAIRLVPLGQTAGVGVIAGLEPVILRAAERAASSTPDDLGSATVVSEIMALRHETQHSRLFRS